MIDLSPRLGVPGVRAVVSGRAEGSLGFTGAPDPAAVREARRAFLAAAGADPAAAVALRQVHGRTILRAGPAHRGAGGLDPARSPGEGDGIATAVEGLPLLALGADCAMVALAAADGRAVAVFHAGWRGAAAGAPAAAVAAMAELGVPPEEIRAAPGPAVGPCCYEVGPEVEAAFREARGEEAARWFRPGPRGRARLDLPAAVREGLVAAGVPPGSVASAGPCTLCDDRWFSHRRGDRGRQALAAWRVEPGLRP